MRSLPTWRCTESEPSSIPVSTTRRSFRSRPETVSAISKLQPMTTGSLRNFLHSTYINSLWARQSPNRVLILIRRAPKRAMSCSEPGWNLHTPAEIGIDDFEADRAPDHLYKTQNLAGLFVQERGLFMRPSNKGRFYHDGRFPTLLDVVKHYNIQFNLGLTDQEKLDLVEYLKSL